MLTQSVPAASSPKKLATLVAALVALSFAACHERSTPAPAQPPQPPQPQAQTRPPAPVPPAWHGYFAGWTWIALERYGAEAQLTADGALRMLVHGPYVPDVRGVLVPRGDATAHQFVGAFTVAGATATGSGVVLSHPCSPLYVHPGCGIALPAAIELATGTDATLIGELSVDASAQPWVLELWSVDDHYGYEASLSSIEGTYVERFAEFAAGTEVVTTIDGNGKLFFQSPATGCVGNGSLTPRGDGSFNVYDVSLRIESCRSAFAHLAGEFEGLATETTNHSGWDCPDYSADCDGLSFWLSSPPGASQPKAMSMWIIPRWW